MKELLIYLAQTIVCSAAFLVLYKSVIAGRASFLFSRSYLLGASICSLAIPLLDIPVYEAAALPAVIHTTDTTASTGQTVAANGDLGIYMVFALYIAVAAALAAIAIKEIFAIRKLKRSSRMTAYRLYRLYESPAIESPFSTAKSIYITSDLDCRQKEQIIAHESSHIRHGHFYELLLATVLRVAFWFNPLMWLMRRNLTELHEYEADSDVLKAGYGVTEYGKLIVNQILGYNPDIACGLNNSLTKKRIIMMTTRKPQRGKVLRIVAPLFLTCGLVTLFGFTQKPETTVEQRASTKTEIMNDPLIFVDGVEVESYAHLSPEQITNLTIFKDSAAIEKYGERGKDGVIEITTSKDGLSGKISVLDGTPVDGLSGEISIINGESGSIVPDKSKKTLIIVDGVARDNVDDLPAEKIVNVTILKDSAAIEKYGERGKDGVMIINTKDSGKH